MPHPRIWCLALAALPLCAALNQPVRTQSGLVAGAPGRDRKITAFKGIPFAAPPTGDLRWRAPQPPAKWQGVRDGGKFGANCIQNIVNERKPWTQEFMAHGEVSEDCLFLNVWTPARAASDKLPVLVYLHGGGNNEGSGSVAVYDGEGLASKGIVMVTVNYRLSLFGFFTHPDLTKESGYHASGNYALLDQIAALQWVQANIAAFGGDPSRVTVAGQSAGASDIQALTASPLAKGLFQRAILESGGSNFPAQAGRALVDQEAAGVRWAQAKGAHSLAELRALPWKDVLAPANLSPAARFGVVVDGHVLTASLADVFAQGKQNDIPTLAGWNADESGASPNPGLTAEQFRAQAQQRYGDHAAEFLQAYPVRSDEDANRQSNQSARDRQRMNLYRWAITRAATSKTPAYLYYWDHVLPGPEAGRYGAFHTSEVPYALNTLSMSDRPFTEADRKIADTMSSYWANFAATGNPNGKGLPHWPAASEHPAAVMEIGDKTGPIPAATDYWSKQTEPQGRASAAR